MGARIALSASVAALVAGLLATSPAAAATLVVGPGGGPDACAAPAFATLQAAASAASTGDTITVCPGAYYLASPVVVTVASLTFAGAGPAMTIVDGGSATQLFSGTSSTLTISGMTLRNGRAPAGGAIRAAAVVALDSVFRDNASSTGSGGAIFTDVATISGSTFAGNVAEGGASAGAVWATGSADVSNSIFASNSAHDGGALVTASATISGSRFTANHADAATGYGGALHTGFLTIVGSTFNANTAQLGGAVSSSWETTIANSTFSGNTAYLVGGALEVGTSLSLANATFSGDRAPIGAAFRMAAHNAATVRNTIIAEAAPVACGGSVISDGGGNVTTDARCGFTAPTSKVVTAAALALQPLGWNGGPTQTVALGATSVAIDAGIDATCAAAPVDGRDQRGMIRPRGAHCDAGAYEATATPTGPPAIATVSPLSGRVGAVVTLMGSGLGTTRNVTFNGVTATFSIRSPIAVVAVVPAGATTGPIRLTNATGTATSAQPFHVRP